MNSREKAREIVTMAFTDDPTVDEAINVVAAALDQHAAEQRQRCADAAKYFSASASQACLNAVEKK